MAPSSSARRLPVPHGKPRRGGTQPQGHGRGAAGPVWCPVQPPAPPHETWHVSRGGQPTPDAPDPPSPCQRAGGCWARRCPPAVCRSPPKGSVIAPHLEGIHPLSRSLGCIWGHPRECRPQSRGGRELGLLGSLPSCTLPLGASPHHLPASVSPHAGAEAPARGCAGLDRQINHPGKGRHDDDGRCWLNETAPFVKASKCKETVSGRVRACMCACVCACMPQATGASVCYSVLEVRDHEPAIICGVGGGALHVYHSGGCEGGV